MQFGVEVLVAIGPSTHVIKKHEATGFQDSLKVAQELATAMFPEDPMATRTFNNGRYVYSNKNDLGDLVVIRPFTETDLGQAIKPPVKLAQALHHGFVFSCGRPDGEPA